MKSSQYLVLEQYDFNEHIITIWDAYGNNFLNAIAVEKRYAHIINHENYWNEDDILKANNINIDNDNMCYVLYEFDDFLVNANCNTKSAESILKFVCKDINESDDNILVVKQIKARNRSYNISRNKRGFSNTAWSHLVRERDKKCIECGSEYQLHAHHIKSYKSFPELRFEVSNGITLCSSCHRKLHKKIGRN